MRKPRKDRSISEVIKQHFSRIKKMRVSDIILTVLIWLFSFITITALAWLLIYIIYNGIGQISFDFLSSSSDTGGILPMIITTLYIVLITVVIATPIGICSAIYLVEYAKPGVIVSIIRFATETLSGIPSIIYGLFGYILFGYYLHLNFSLLTGAFTLCIMVLPTIIRTTEEALKSVPIMFKEGSLALGATKLTTIYKIVLPCAIPGILAAVILSIGRIVGETAALIFTLGTEPKSPDSVMSSGRTLAEHLYILAKEGISFEKAFATATVLIILVGVINFIANLIGSKLSRTTT